MKKFLVLGFYLAGVCFADEEIIIPEPNVDRIAVQEEVVIPEPNVSKLPKKTITARKVPISAEDLECVNHAIDPEEDIHVVSIDYQEDQLKHMKVDAFVSRGGVQVSTRYELMFNTDACELKIEDYITGMENVIPQKESQDYKYSTESYAVHCFKEGETFCSTFERIGAPSSVVPVKCGQISCCAPAADELQVVQKMVVDHGQFIAALRSSIEANIRGILEGNEKGPSFEASGETGVPGKLLHDLFESKLRIYLYKNILATLLPCAEPNNPEKQLEERTDQG